MDEIEIAKQLRKPEGEAGKKVAEKMNETNLHIYELTFEAMNNWENNKILEIGFGNGHFIHRIVNSFNNVSYTGIDFSETMVNEANDRNKDLIDSGVVELKNAVSNDIPYPNDTFDKILTINTLYFWENPEKDLNEIFRVLKKDGSLYLSIRTRDRMKNLPFSKYNFNLFMPDEVQKLLERSKFKVINSFHKIEPVRIVYEKEVEIDSLCLIAKKL